MQSKVLTVALLVGLGAVCIAPFAVADSPPRDALEAADDDIHREESPDERKATPQANQEMEGRYTESHIQTENQGEEALDELTEQLLALEAKVREIESAQTPPDNSTETRLSALEKLTNHTTLGGRMYANYTYINHKDSLTGKSDKSGTGLDVKRFYLDVSHRFDDTWSVYLTTDITYYSANKTVTPFVKKAYIQAKLGQAAVLRVGAASTPWVPFAEKHYGYRYIENTLADRRKVATSADWGVHLSGELGDNKRVNYAVSAVTGHGYKNPTRSKGMDVEARIGVVPVNGMIVAVGGYIGFRGQNLESADVERTAQRLNVMVAYASDSFRVGGEYFITNNWNNIATTTTDQAYGVSLWGSVNLPSNFAVFGRYDHTKPRKTLNPSAKSQYYNAGLEYEIRDGIQIALVYKHEKDTTAPNHNVKTHEVGVFGQASF